MHSTREIGGWVGAFALFMAIIAVSIDHLFDLQLEDGQSPKTKAICGWSHYHLEHGYSINYFDSINIANRYFGKSGIAGRVWIAFMILSIVFGFIAVELVLIPSLKEYKRGPTFMFITSGLMALIGAASAFGKGECSKHGTAGVSIYLAFIFAWIFMWIAALLVFLDIRGHERDNQVENPQSPLTPVHLPEPAQVGDGP